jgi:hypothetical protein
LKNLESKNLIIAFTWTFVLISIIVISWQGQGMEFMGYMMFFVMALIATIIVEALFPGKPENTELKTELMEMRARLDALNGEAS